MNEEENINDGIIRGADIYTIYGEHKVIKCTSHIENLAYTKQFLQSMKKAGYHLYKNNKKVW